MSSCHMSTEIQIPNPNVDIIAYQPISCLEKQIFNKIKKIFCKRQSITQENRFDFLKRRQKTPANAQSQRGLKSNDCNIPAGGRYNNKLEMLHFSLNLYFIDIAYNIVYMQHIKLYINFRYIIFIFYIQSIQLLFQFLFY